MPRKKPDAPARTRRTFTEEFRREAVQMLLDGQSAPSVAERLGLSSPNVLYVWKKKSLDQAGPAGAIGALGIIMAFNFGGKPVYVMPLVFGGAPVVATLVSTISEGLLGKVGPMFLAGLILAIAGSAMVLVFAPKGAPHAPAPVPAPVPTPEPPAAASEPPAAAEG